MALLLRSVWETCFVVDEVTLPRRPQPFSAIVCVDFLGANWLTILHYCECSQSFEQGLNMVGMPRPSVSCTNFDTLSSMDYESLSARRWRYFAGPSIPRSEAKGEEMVNSVRNPELAQERLQYDAAGPDQA